MAASKNQQESDLVSRTALYFNNKEFSNVRFQVPETPGGENVIFYAHKFILAAASTYFKEHFYGEKARNPDSVKLVKCPFTNSHALYIMLRYLYCDELSLVNTNDAAQVLKIANRYSINDLEQLCWGFISNFSLSPLNVLDFYEIAMLPDYNELRAKCRKMMGLFAHDVCGSDAFLNCSVSVIQDIFELNTMNLSNEVTLARALMKWGEMELKRQRRPLDKDQLRYTVQPFLKNLRLLTFSLQEFLRFKEEYKVFFDEEEMVIIAKLKLDSDIDMTYPDYFCSSTEPRKKISSCNRTSINKNEPYEVNNPQSQTSIESETISSENHNISTCSGEQVTDTSVQPIAMCVSKVMPQNQNSSSICTTNLNETPFDFIDFHLEKQEGSFGSAVVKDVKCITKILMKKGKIFVHGIDLSIANQEANVPESIIVHLCATKQSSGFVFDSEIDSKLVDNNLSLSFPAPFFVAPSDPLQIEVGVKNLKLSRCLGSKLLSFKLMKAVNADITLISNSSVKSGSYSKCFLISRLKYSVVST